MSSTEIAAEQNRKVEATLIYAVDTGEKPVSTSTGPNRETKLLVGDFEPRQVAVHDARPRADSLSLEREGFELARLEPGITDFRDETQLREVYYPRVEQLIQARTGASRVVIFDHTLRSGAEGQRQGQFREPAKVVHNDYTEDSAPKRVREVFPADEAEALLAHRFAIVQVWQSIGHAVQESPLAICSAETLGPAERIAAERRHPDRVGEIYHIAFSSAHQWFYFPELSPDEALVFKCYDSARDGRSRFTAHTAFDDPTSPEDAPPRQSIELRAFAFFAPSA